MPSSDLRDRDATAPWLAPFKRWASRHILLNPPVYAHTSGEPAVDIACGTDKVSGTFGFDAELLAAVDGVADVHALPFRSGSCKAAYAMNILEHLTTPYPVLDEVHRILIEDGRLIVRVPNIGTYAAHLDPTHRFLADCDLWRRILGGYFASVRVVPFGLKYPASPHWIQRALIGAGFKDLAHGFDFICSRKKERPTREYIGWWMEKR